MKTQNNMGMTLVAAAGFCLIFASLFGSELFNSEDGKGKSIRLIDVEKERVLKAAKTYLKQAPTPITDFFCNRSTGGRHDYFSEGDYWWPDPKNPNGPYIRRDGETNPDNFIKHRHALIRLSIQSAVLASAYRITGDETYARHAVKHLRAWFIDPNTIMNPHLQYAQAIHGVCTGRGTGIIDTIHLVEVVKAIQLFESFKALTPADLAALRKWFKSYLEWVSTSKYGIDERESTNNHSSAWIFQVAAFAQFVGDSSQLEFCRKRFKESVLPGFMNDSGGFSDELNGLAHRLDPSRLTAIRKSEEGSGIVDIFSPSIWAGWYSGIYKGYEKALTKAYQQYPKFLHMEWGGDSHVGRHTENPVTGEGKVREDGWAEKENLLTVTTRSVKQVDKTVSN